MNLIPLAGAGAISEAAGTVLEKKVLRKHKVNYKDYHVFSFFSIVAIIGILIPLILLFYPSLWAISPEALSLKNLGIMAFIVVSSIIANLSIFYAVKWEKVTELQPIRLLQPLFVILLAFIFYASERQTDFRIISAALIASLALVFSHIKKHHLVFNKYSISALLGSLFFAMELVTSKSILDYYSPLSFYFIRCFFIFLFSYMIFKSNPTTFGKKNWIYTLVIAAIWVFYRVLLYSSYTGQGVIFTTLLFLLAPVFVYILSYFYLKEKPTWKNIVSAGIIILCVAYAVWTSG